MAVAVLDSHVHVWRGAEQNPWVAGQDLLDRAWLPEHIDGAGDDEFIFVEADATDSHEEVAWVRTLDWRGLRGIVARLDLSRRSFPERLRELRSTPGVVGVRVPSSDLCAGPHGQEATVSALMEVAQTGLVVDACVRHHELRQLRDVVRQVPHLTVVLDHMGKPPLTSGRLTSWRIDMAELAQLQNVVVKLSGVSPESHPLIDLESQSREVLMFTLDNFGADRCMVGSDWPVSSAVANWRSRGSWFELVLDGVGLNSRERLRVARQTASTVYGLVAR